MDTDIYVDLDITSSSDLNILHIRYVHLISPVATGVLNNNVVILINATYCSGRCECLKHAVGPSAVAMLERLNDLEV